MRLASLRHWLRFGERRAGRRYMAAVPEEVRGRIRREVEEGARPVVRLRRGDGQ